MSRRFVLASEDVPDPHGREEIDGRYSHPGR